MKGLFLVAIQVAAAEEGSESYTQAKEAATTAEEEAATWIANFDPKPLRFKTAYFADVPGTRHALHCRWHHLRDLRIS